MKGTERRSQILQWIRESATPVPANLLAERFGVSRQSIVQDVALLRAEHYAIISTNRGYVLAEDERATRVFKMYHKDCEISDELNAIVDLGGTVEDVFVQHRVYGKLESVLHIETRVHVAEYARSLQGGMSKPLLCVTDGYHYHTVSAESEAVLDEIESTLRQKGFLVEK